MLEDEGAEVEGEAGEDVEEVGARCEEGVEVVPF